MHRHPYTFARNAHKYLHLSTSSYKLFKKPPLVWNANRPAFEVSVNIFCNTQSILQANSRQRRPTNNHSKKLFDPRTLEHQYISLPRSINSRKRLFICTHGSPGRPRRPGGPRSTSSHTGAPCPPRRQARPRGSSCNRRRRRCSRSGAGWSRL